MESIIKNRYLWCGRHQLINRFYTSKMSFIVNRCEVNQLLYALFHLGSYQATLFEKVTTLHYSMAYSSNLIEVFNRSKFRIEKTFKY